MMSTAAQRPARPTALTLALCLPMWLVGCAHGTGARAAQPNGGPAQATHKSRGDHDAFRNTVPAPEPSPALHLPMPERMTLDNGIALWVFPKRDLPLVQVVTLITSGSAADPAGHEGLASLTAEVMRRGTRSRSAQAIALEVENAGGALDVDVGDDATVVEAGALKQNIGPVLDVMADILQHATFEASAFERAQKQRLTELMQLHNEPRACAQTVFRKVAFGAHPYGHTGRGSPKSIRGLHANTLKRFYSQHVVPANTQIIVVGDVSTDEARAMVEDRLGAWRGSPVQLPKPSAAKQQPREIALVHRPEAAQAQLSVGGIGLSRSDADYYPAVLANAVLGGLFNSRLNMNLREDKGWTYGVRSMFAFLRAPGPFVVSTSIRNDAAVAGITEIFKEIDRMRREKVSEEELTAAKNRFTLSLPANFESLEGIAQMLSTLALHDLPLTYYRDLPAALAQVTAQDVLRVMQQHVVPEKLQVVVVGDADELQAPLEALKLGQVRLRDGEGQLVRRGPAPAPKPALQPASSR